MKKALRGFTIVEVSLFLAVTALIFAGIAVGTQNSIFQQRYNDAVQTFAEFLRTEYSRVENVQSNGGGRDNRLMYGRLIVFGESKDLSGANNTNGTVFSYSVIGNDIDSITDESVRNGLRGAGTLGYLRGLEFNVGIVENGTFKWVGYTDSYTPRWGSRIQTTGGWNGSKYEPFKGIILIVRDPESGTVRTLVKQGTTIDINGGGNPGNELRNTDFKAEQIDMCVNPNGDGQSNLRKDIRIVENARNASGVEVIDGNGNCME